MTTVGTDIFQIVFTAGYAAISQYAIYGFIFYTLAMGMLLGSLIGIQIGAMVTKVVPGITIRGFYAMAVLAGFVNRIFALPAKLGGNGCYSHCKGDRGRFRDDWGLGILHRDWRILGLGNRHLFGKHWCPQGRGGKIMIANKKNSLAAL